MQEIIIRQLGYKEKEKNSFAIKFNYLFHRKKH